jgi:hypothetical protein
VALADRTNIFQQLDQFIASHWGRSQSREMQLAQLRRNRLGFADFVVNAGMEC